VEHRARSGGPRHLREAATVTRAEDDVRAGERHGIPTPLNRMLVTRMRTVDRVRL
jgi:hypothetical protein